MRQNDLSHNLLSIDNFLTPIECSNLIQQSEAIGYKSADVDLSTSRQVLSHIRNNDRVNLNSPELAQQLWQKLNHFELPIIEKQQASALSPHFRFYRYIPGQKFNMHKDGRQQVDGKTTLCTLLIYLNDNLTGGATTFRQDNIELQPKTGSLVIFEHHLWHSGRPVTTGCKYVLRTDVVYG